MIVFENLDKKLELVRNHSFYKEYIELYKNRFDEFENNEIPALNYSDFICFKNNGTRHEFENKYFERRDRLVTSFILYLIYNEDKYYNMLLDSMWAICGEISWVVPAHLPLKDVSKFRTHIDIFAAETAEYLSEIVYLIGDRLPEELKNLVVYEVQERIFVSYETGNFWWETLNSNWAAVCAGSIGMAYMQIAPERFEKVKDRLLDTINCFLDGYGDDGCCIEGPAYWEYGFGYFINFADMLYKFTDGKTDLLHNRKVENIALYLQFVIMRKDILVSFSDSGRSFKGINIGLYSFLCDTYKATVPFVKKKVYEQQSSGCRLSYAVRNFLWSDPGHYENNKTSLKDVTKYYEDAKWFVVKKKQYTFAAKAGHNGEEHNHNDIGSFIFADDSGQILVDIGSMEYTKENFAPQTRYTFLQNSSLGHSVPIIGGHPQKEGKEFFGKVIKVNENGFSLEMQNAYDVYAENVTRSFAMLENGVKMSDSFVTEENEIIERFVSLIRPSIENDGVHIGNAVLICDKAPVIDSQRIILHSGAEVIVYLIDFMVNDNKFEIEILLESL